MTTLTFFIIALCISLFVNIWQSVNADKLKEKNSECQELLGNLTDENLELVNQRWQLIQDKDDLSLELQKLKGTTYISQKRDKKGRFEPKTTPDV